MDADSQELAVLALASIPRSVSETLYVFRIPSDEQSKITFNHLTTSGNHYSLMSISLHITHYMFRPTCRPSSGVANTKL
jgi:hypothetical protein